MAVHAIVVAAGQGRRFGRRKQFVLVNGVPLFVHATRVLQQHRQVRSITLVVPRGERRRVRSIVKDLALDKVRHIVAGGTRRQDSVKQGLKTIKNTSGMLIIHDAVRPFITAGMITRGIATCRRRKAVIFAIPVHDTVKKVIGKRVRSTVPREDLYLVQTPQFYDLETLRKAMGQVDMSDEYTDESQIMEAAGQPVYVCAGGRFNVKVTDPHDLLYIRRLLA